MSDVFVGLVTHARSRFNADESASRQARELAAALAQRRLTTDVLISDRDDYSAEDFPLTRADLIRSASHVSRLEYRWRRFVAHGGGQPHRSAAADAAFWLAMAAKRVGTADRGSAVRLLNIDLSHLRVMDAALADGAPWALVLEDDARATSVLDTADSLVEVLEAVAGTSVEFVNLSESLPLAKLGVQGLLRGPAIEGGPSWLQGTSLPITNTVCANLYSAAFLTRLVDGIRSEGLLPVVPIDWRLNEQMMRMWTSGALDASSGAWVRPGIFRQGSMHDLAV